MTSDDNSWTNIVTLLTAVALPAVRVYELPPVLELCSVMACGTNELGATASVNVRVIVPVLRLSMKLFS